METKSTWTGREPAHITCSSCREKMNYPISHEDWWYHTDRGHSIIWWLKWWLKRRFKK